VARRAPFLVCPCCVGKLAQRATEPAAEAGGDTTAAPPTALGWNNGKGWVEAAADGSAGADGAAAPPDEVLRLPRSEWLRSQQVDTATFCALARRAERPDELGRRCKAVMELDRCAAVSGAAGSKRRLP
jgi:hypothetical protein